MSYNKEDSFYNFVFLSVIASIFSFFLYKGLDKDLSEKTHFFNIDVVIVSKGDVEYVKPHHKHRAQYVKTWLVRSVKDTTLYREFSSLQDEITNEMWYSYDVGDTLHYVYLRKDKFFKLKK